MILSQYFNKLILIWIMSSLNVKWNIFQTHHQGSGKLIQMTARDGEIMNLHIVRNWIEVKLHFVNRSSKTVLCIFFGYFSKFLYIPPSVNINFTDTSLKTNPLIFLRHRLFVIFSLGTFTFFVWMFPLECSSNAPLSYEGNHRDFRASGVFTCSWVLTVPENYTVKLTITQMNVDSGGNFNCTNDHLQVFALTCVM